MNPMQNYPHITELLACTLKIFAPNAFVPNEFFNFFRNILNSNAIEINNFSFSTK